MLCRALDTDDPPSEIYLRGQQDSVFHQRRDFHTVWHKFCVTARAFSHTAETQGNRGIWPVLWVLTRITGPDLTLVMPAARMDPAHKVLPADGASRRGQCCWWWGAYRQPHSRPEELLPQHTLFYLTIPFPFPEFLERAWRSSRFLSLKRSLHMEIKTFRKGFAMLIALSSAGTLKELKEVWSVTPSPVTAKTVCFQWKV